MLCYERNVQIVLFWSYVNMVNKRETFSAFKCNLAHIIPGLEAKVIVTLLKDGHG